MSDHKKKSIADQASLDAGYEKSDINVLAIAVLAVACILLVAGFAVGLNDFFLMTKESIYKEYVASKRSPEVLELEDSEHQLLTTYGVVDKEKGIYRIPIERAMNLIMEESSAH